MKEGFGRSKKRIKSDREAVLMLGKFMRQHAIAFRNENFIPGRGWTGEQILLLVGVVCKREETIFEDEFRDVLRYCRHRVKAK